MRGGSSRAVAVAAGGDACGTRSAADVPMEWGASSARACGEITAGSGKGAASMGREFTTSRVRVAMGHLAGDKLALSARGGPRHLPSGRFRANPGTASLLRVGSDGLRATDGTGVRPPSSGRSRRARSGP